MPKPYSLDLRERVVNYVESGHSRRAAAAHFSVSPSFVINLMTAFRQRGAVAPKALGGWRHSKLDPHRVFILRRVAEKDDISMPELAGELQAASGVKADPASLSRWLIRNGLSFKKSLQASECDRPDVLPLRARRGRLNDSPKCRPSPIGWCSSTKPEPSFDRLRTKMTRARGRCDRGQRLRSKAPFGHWKTQTFVAGLRVLSPDCAVGHRRADGPGDLRHLRAHPARPDAATRRHRHPGQSARPQKPSRRTGHPRQGRLAPVPAALQPKTSIPSKWPSPNSRRTCAPWPCAPSTNSGRRSAKSATSSPPKNAQTTSKPQVADS